MELNYLGMVAALADGQKVKNIPNNTPNTFFILTVP